MKILQCLDLGYRINLSDGSVGWTFLTTKNKDCLLILRPCIRNQENVY